jgi:hypothetical protein
LKETHAGILNCPISDHLPTFMALKITPNNYVKKPKHVKVQTQSAKAHADFISELAATDRHNLFDFDINANPLETYPLFKNKLESLQTKHFPTKLVRFNKYKHKLANWITKGILISIKFRDDLYKKAHSTSLGTPLRKTLETNLKVYNHIRAVARGGFWVSVTPP